MKFDTKLVHSGYQPYPETVAGSPPIFQTASYTYQDAQQLHEVFAGKQAGYLYSRIANPTITFLENRLVSLENGLGAVATASGMSAIFATVLTLVQSGEEIVTTRGLFGGTIYLFEEILKPLNIIVRYVEPTNLKQIKQAINHKTRFIFTESLSNPALEIPDLEGIHKVSKEAGIPFVVDSTVTTPYLLAAKQWGADIIIHSTTKFISGHGNAVGGILIDSGLYEWKRFSGERIKKACEIFGRLGFLAAARRQVVQNMGACQSPFNAYLTALGLETLSLRMEKHCHNALILARFLKDQPQVSGVNYPGLDEQAFHSLAKKQFNGYFGALLTFQLKDQAACYRFLNALKLVKQQVNLGDARTLGIHPDSSIFLKCTVEQRQMAGVTPEMVRISVGIEDIEDIQEDIQQALTKV